VAVSIQRQCVHGGVQRDRHLPLCAQGVGARRAYSNSQDRRLLHTAQQLGTSWYGVDVLCACRLVCASVVGCRMFCTLVDR
jgi:hypothetical protein